MLGERVQKIETEGLDARIRDALGLEEPGSSDPAAAE